MCVPIYAYVINGFTLLSIVFNKLFLSIVIQTFLNISEILSSRSEKMDDKTRKIKEVISVGM